MIAAYLRQLNYMTDRKSWAYVARQTDMPVSMLKQVVSGKIELSDKYKSDVRNAFRRESYADLRETGFSSMESRRWSTYRPETVNIKTTNLRLKIADLTTGALAKWVNTTDEDVTQRIINEKWDSLYKDIQEGIRSSKLATEDIMDY